MMEFAVAGIQIYISYILFFLLFSFTFLCYFYIYIYLFICFFDVYTYTRHGLNLVLPQILVDSFATSFIDGEIWYDYTHVFYIVLFYYVIIILFYSFHFFLFCFVSFRFVSFRFVFQLI